MKIMKAFKYVLLGTCLTLVTSCDDAELKVIDNGVYIEESTPSDKFNQQVETQLVDDSNVTLPLTIRLAQAVDSDVTVTLGIDSAIVDEYNQQNETNYQVLPEEYRSFKKTVTIPAGEISAPVVNLVVKPYVALNGEAYAIPIRIISIEGPVTSIGSGSHILYLLTSPLKQETIILNYRNSTSMVLANEIPMDQWTFEFWIKVDNTTSYPIEPWEGAAYKSKRLLMFTGNSNPITFSGLTIRFYPSGATIQMPILQFQKNNDYFDSTSFWYPDTWYHIAYTFDGTVVRLYKDGSENTKKDFNTMWSFYKLDFCQNFSSTQQVEFAQIRMWKKCLSETVIQDNMSRQVPGDSEDLIGYWKCDEGEGSTLTDSSPYQNHISLRGTPSWSELVNFAHPNE